MGNTLGAKKSAKVMKINGETIKSSAGVKAGDILKDYSGHVLLESESVKHFGIRAKPLEPHEQLQVKRLYFLVELPEVQKHIVPRRVRSGINMSAKDRLENLMLSRRSTSDLSIMKPPSTISSSESSKEGLSPEDGGVRVKMRLPAAEVEKLIKESKDEAEAAEKILGLYMVKKGNGGRETGQKGKENEQQMHWNSGNGRVGEGIKVREKRVSFKPIRDSEIQVAVTS